MMRSTLVDKSRYMIQIDEDGQVIIPPELSASFGLLPGTQLLVDPQSYGLFLHRPTSHLAKVYVEATNQCNLNCRTCIRNVWKEPVGFMSMETFQRILQGLSDISQKPTLFFGGYGEPLCHPDIIDMVTEANTAGASVELITNAHLLSEEMSKQLISAGLNTLWISLDGANPGSYADVRISEMFEKVIQNINILRFTRGALSSSKPEIGVAFVAMKRNIGDLPSLIRLSSQLGASQYMITNVLPHTQEMCDEALYYQVMGQHSNIASSWLPHVNMPRIDLSNSTFDPLFKTLRSDYNISINGFHLNQALNRCPFIEKGAVAIRWNGDVSPCLPLMHDHSGFLDGRPRFVKGYIVGNINDHTFKELWEEKEYQDFRTRVQQFDFSPCTQCGGCDLSETNEKDCFGNTFPTCGGCLWAQGLIQCP